MIRGVRVASVQLCDHISINSGYHNSAMHNTQNNINIVILTILKMESRQYCIAQITEKNLLLLSFVMNTISLFYIQVVKTIQMEK